MEINCLARLIAAHVRFIVLVSLVAALAGVAATYVLPEDYLASTTILIRPQQNVEFAPSQKSMLDFPPSFNQPPESISQTYAGVMTSAAVATRVVDLLKLDTLRQEPDPRWYVRTYRGLRDRVKVAIKYGWDFARFGRVEEEDPYWAAVRRVGEALAAEPIQDTYLFSLTATWQDPHIAALIADTAADVFIEYTQDARRAEGSTSVAFLDAKLDERGPELDSARERLAAFRTANNAASLEHQLSLKLETLAELEATQEEALKQVKEVRAEVGSLEQLMAEESEVLHTSTTTESSPIVLQLKQDLDRDMVLLAGLKETHMPAHPDMRALTARIEEAQRRIQGEAERIRFRDTTELNPFYRDMRAKLLDRKVTLVLLDAGVAAFEQSIARYRTEVARLSNVRADLSRLELDVEVIENEYRLLTEEHVEARLAAAQDISEIRALANAIPPVYPAGPVKIYYGVGGLAAGLLVALFLVLVSDYTDPRIRTADDVVRVVGTPVLAQVPAMSTARRVTVLLGTSASHQALVCRIASPETSEPGFS